MSKDFRVEERVHRSLVVGRSIAAFHTNRATRASTIIPNYNPNRILFQFNKRADSDYGHPNYRLETLIEETYSKYEGSDSPDVLSRGPSYTKFKIPYPMICQKRYTDSLQAYEAQLEKEIRYNIDFQSRAADACYFVRCMAYTTFWPPMHNMKEVKHTSKHFFQLTEKEKWRLQIIMDTDIT